MDDHLLGTPFWTAQCLTFMVHISVPVFQCSPDVNTNKAFIDVATHCMILQPRRLSTCLLSDEVVTPGGTVVTRPETWT